MSAPIHVVGVSTAISSDAGQTLQVDVPRTAKNGHTLVCVLAWSASLTPPTFEDDGWSGLTDEVDTGFGLVALQRTVDDTTSATYSFAFTGAMGAGEYPPMAVMFLVESIETIPSADWAVRALTNVGPSPSTAGHTITMPSFRDVALLAWALNDVGGYTVRADEVGQVSGTDTGKVGSLVVVLYKPEAAGNIANQSVTLTSGSAVADGCDLYVVLDSERPDYAEELTKMDPPGAIGLPWVGA